MCFTKTVEEQKYKETGSTRGCAFCCVCSEIESDKKEGRQLTITYIQRENFIFTLDSLSTR